MAEPGGELLDVVDAEDRVIGVASRAEIHAQRLRHRAVHVLIRDAQGRLYLQRRAEYKDCDPGLWDSSAAGHVGHDEAYASAAPRELAEELGLTGVALVALCRLPASAATGYEFVQAYLGLAVTEPVPDPGEIAETRWCTPAALAAWMSAEPDVFTASFRAIFAAYHASRALE